MEFSAATVLTRRGVFPGSPLTFNAGAWRNRLTPLLSRAIVRYSVVHRNGRQSRRTAAAMLEPGILICLVGHMLPPPAEAELLVGPESLLTDAVCQVAITSRDGSGGERALN